MRAIQYAKNGGPEVLELVDRPIPAAGAGEVRVRIVVSGLNPTDWKSRAGSAAGTPVDPSQVPGQDGAGIVDAVGDGVDSLTVGQRVWIWDSAFKRPNGTSQEFVTLPARQVVGLPDAASLDLGASLGIPALTAHRALTANEHGPAQLSPGALSGHTVLVAGGAGAVGHAAIELARWAGAVVITTVSSADKADLASAAGAHHVLNYREDNVSARVFEISPTGVDTIVEVNPRANMALDEDIIKPGGTVSIYVSDDEDTLPISARLSMTKNIRYQFILTYTVTAEQKQHAVDAVSAAVADGALKVGADAGLPLTRFPLEQTADAHRAVEANVVGKVLIEVSQEAAR